MKSVGFRCVAVLGAAVLTLVVVASTGGRVALSQNGGGKAEALPGFDVLSLDRSASACQDFNQFANGGWKTKNPIPAAYSRWGRFEMLAEQNNEQLHDILEGLAKRKNLKAGGNEQKLADFYSSCMDEAAVETQGAKPLEPELARIGAIKDIGGVQEEVARFHAHRIPALFGFGAVQDYKNSTAVIAQAVQGGLGLPDRDYYTGSEERARKIREEYVAHVARTFQLLGDDAEKANAAARTVMAVETRLAENSATREQLRNPEARYNPKTKAQLLELTPHFDWGLYFRNIGLPEVAKINVGHPPYLEAVDKMLVDVPVEDWKTYLRWHLVNAASNTLSSKFVEESFNFNGKFLNGTQEQLPRWKRCVASTDRALGEALGQLYIDRTFTPKARARAQEMVKNLVAALREDLTTLSWMSDPTRTKAIAKLDAFVRKIGYPDKWRSYEPLQVTRGAYYNNSVSVGEFDFRRNVGKIGRPIDRAEWAMSPPTVNAYYNASMNEIVFPAGILQSPFFSEQADDAFNYGGIGAVIGHEMTHGFDDSGAKFDADGNLVMWWTPDDFKKFNERTDCVVQQFDAFEVEPGLFQKGKRVVGESVADLGGLTVAYAAYKKSLEGKPRPKTIAGFTPEQRFFLGWAQVWAQNIRPEAARVRVNTDPHPLGRFRVNGPLSNMPAFAEAFQCKAGDPMVRPADRRCQIW